MSQVACVAAIRICREALVTEGDVGAGRRCLDVLMSAHANSGAGRGSGVPDS